MLWICLCLSVLLPSDELPSVDQVGSLSEKEFEDIHFKMIPFGVEKWMTVPWETRLEDAAEKAKAAKKPIFLWSREGHPLGSTSHLGILDRAELFTNDQVVRLLRGEFVPLALDSWYMERKADREGDLYRRVVYQREGLSVSRSTEGLYAFAPDGFLIDSWTEESKVSLLDFLRTINDTYRPYKSNPNIRVSADPPELEDIHRDVIDLDHHRVAPEDGLILETFTRVYDATFDDDYPKMEIFREAVGRDFVWITGEERKQLQEGELPPSIALRLARFHMVDNTRGDAKLWSSESVKRAQITRKKSQLIGSFALANQDSSRTFNAKLQGRIKEDDDEKLSHFDAVIIGIYEDRGAKDARFAPKGKYKLAIGLRIAAAETPGSSTPPRGARDLEQYLRHR